MCPTSAAAGPGCGNIPWRYFDNRNAVDSALDMFLSGFKFGMMAIFFLLFIIEKSKGDLP
jgi:hypothetical protein